MKTASFLTTFALVAAAVSANEPGCTLTGNYTAGTDVSSCSNVLIDSLFVPAGVQLDLTKLKDGASVTFQGTTTFGTQLWAGPLILMSGNNLKVSGNNGVLEGQGSWYWPYGQKVTRPVFFRLKNVTNSIVTNFRVQNMPFRTFSVNDCQELLIDSLTIDSRAGENLAKNTDGFDLSRNVNTTIRNCRVYNQDDCLAMQSSKNTFFINNYCHGGHGISIGSLGGAVVDVSDTVDGLTVYNNQIVNNTNGLRIKTIIELEGLVQNIKYINNVLNNVDNAIVVHSDYNKTKGGYSGQATSNVLIRNITIDQLSGTATNLYDVFVNSNVASNWQFTNINVNAASRGSCVNQPSNILCA